MTVTAVMYTNASQGAVNAPLTVAMGGVTRALGSVVQVRAYRAFTSAGLHCSSAWCVCLSVCVCVCVCVLARVHAQTCVCACAHCLCTVLACMFACECAYHLYTITIGAHAVRTEV